ncbi:MAG: tRNA pseudouridine(38-40) synthase TruA [Planctomycetes bacterium]|nr:tRNA pseudouridine(38-40) synthase TruA [Planctomycetota bacterium]
MVEETWDHSLSRLRNLKLTIAYDGTAYAGWQVQKEGPPTVQGELVKAVERIVVHPVELHGASRTDRGVHALGQVASLKTTRAIPEKKLLLAFNTYLPPDIVVTKVEEAEADFDARRSATGKHYRYTLLRSPVRSPFAGRFSLRWGGPLDLEAMRAAARHFVGDHDFQAFATHGKNPPPMAMRTVYEVSMVEDPPFLHFHVLGRSFLYNMVRAMVGTLLEVGGGRRSPSSVEEALRSRDRRRAGPTAPAQGLCLMRVFYQEEWRQRSEDRPCAPAYPLNG